MAIIALGVGFFAGIKATAPSMYNLAETYYRDSNLMDYRLVSTVGFDEDDVEAVSAVSGVTSVMPSYYCDAQLSSGTGGDVVRLIAVPQAYSDSEALNTLTLKEGRLPQSKGEIVIEEEGLSGSNLQIGDTVAFAETAGDNDLTEQLDEFEYTIVGMVESPLYISYQRGSTTVGDGSITQFMYILPDNFCSQRYTELYVKTDISEMYSAFSDEYDEEIESMANTLESTADARCEVFNSDVIGAAEQELKGSWDEYYSEKEKADSELADAEEELERAESEFNDEISAAQQELDDAEGQIESADEQLQKSRDEYYSQISSAESALAAKESELSAAREEYEASKAEFDEMISRAQAEIDRGWDEYNTAYSEFTGKLESALSAGDVQTESTADELSNVNSAAYASGTLAVPNAQLEQAKSSLEQSKKELEALQESLDAEKQMGQAQLDSAFEELEQGEQQLNAAKSELEVQKAEGLTQLEAAEEEINSAQQAYEDGKTELEEQKTSGRQKLDDAQTEYDENRTEAEEKFADAKAELDQAQEEVDGLTSPEWYVFTRDDNPGYSTFSQNADRLDAVASVFPLFFLLVAVLVCVTTMTRLIEEKRTEIATMKALGYGNAAIVMKFVIYSLTAGIIGSVIGIAIGVSTLPFIIYNAYKIMYYIGDITLVVNVSSIVIGIAAAVVCTTAVSVIVCMRSLHTKPATAMRPKAPKPGKRIVLEKITPLWKRLSFNSKLTARNLLRYKSRLFMTVIGVAGCTALIVAAFGLLNSFDPLTIDQFETIYKYNTVIVPEDSGTESELEYLTDTAENDADISAYMLMMQEEASVVCGSNVKDGDTTLVAVQSPENLPEIISLHTRREGTELSLTDEGVLLNEKLADELDAEVGDMIELSSDSGTAKVKVTGIYEQYLYNYVYMTADLYSELYGSEACYNMMDVKLGDTSEEAKSAFSSEYLDDSRITAVTFIDSSLEDFENMLSSLDLVVIVMIICAAALAFVVLYNLTNINIAERVREIATFKVLGFHNGETSSFIYRENIVLTILGIAAGLILGNFLTGFIVQTVEVDNVMFGRDIYFTSYLCAAGLTALFALIVNAVMSIKIKSVNMVESLKSVE